MEISERVGIKHPAYKGVFQVMTTDLLIDLEQEGIITTHAVAVKYAKDLENKRVIEKLELERNFWESQGFSWFIFTEQEVPKTLIQNIKWLIPHLYNFELDQQNQQLVFSEIWKALQTYPEAKIAHVMSLLDENKGVKRGTYLLYLRHLLAQQAFYWNMSNINHRSLRSNQIQASEHWLKGKTAYVYA